MGKVTKAGAAETQEGPGFAGQYGSVGDYTVGFEAYSEHADLAPLFKGLPDDRCQATHWGVVLNGTMTYRYGDGSEDVIGPGEAYVALPGHTPVIEAGTEIVEFTKTDELNETIAVVMKNIEASSTTSR